MQKVSTIRPMIFSFAALWCGAYSFDPAQSAAPTTRSRLQGGWRARKMSCQS